MPMESGSCQTIHTYFLVNIVVFFSKHILGVLTSPIKCRQRADITNAIDWDAKPATTQANEM